MFTDIRERGKKGGRDGGRQWGQGERNSNELPPIGALTPGIKTTTFWLMDDAPVDNDAPTN